MSTTAPVLAWRAQSSFHSCTRVLRSNTGKGRKLERALYPNTETTWLDEFKDWTNDTCCSCTVLKPKPALMERGDEHMTVTISCFDAAVPVGARRSVLIISIWLFLLFENPKLQLTLIARANGFLPDLAASATAPRSDLHCRSLFCESAIVEALLFVAPSRLVNNPIRSFTRPTTASYAVLLLAVAIHEVQPGLSGRVARLFLRIDILDS